ncbi:MAG: 16S rRNA (guanine(966)-N(2))-methyltransferase RsmD [Lamprobacter sp.]|uniref:16S rRNA (guanine(966)-N(2))-methyltransferase RsmD n=1 Tax=Lamprobacter sp. TaxID=3100796 RepID=UPI002B25CCEF|nr:16S rRNA (guanine(966)-N(2))-methyltransferase RsmD [Lamprobacter sp.]MEA3639888.1 16S rRNA (guanine(966)-N(2))-methyltransferase RsmD [Lamprobacter sp.]
MTEPGRIRIIGGCWRGRRLPVASQPGLRPTPDRVRETLFNWLAPVIEGSRCLDCFAGSGALGLEAASRGAARVIQIERSPAVVGMLRANGAALGAQQLSVYAADALAWLTRSPVTPFDICFLDPPFAADLLAPTLEMLAQRGWLAASARVYVETDSATALPVLPTDWRWLRDKRAGQVRYALAETNPER